MPFVQRVARAGRVAGWVASVALVTACGGSGPKGNEYVSYRGPTLVVEGTEFKREGSMEPSTLLVPGRIVVKPDSGQEDDALVLIERFGLTLEGRSSRGALLVNTPEGFEAQWATALLSQLGGRTAVERDSAHSPTAIETAAPASEGNAVAGEPVPDHEPSDDDVRRLVIELYEQIEDAGGFPMTVTATGKAVVIHSKVFSVQKESCRKEVRAKPGEWTCEAALMMAMCSGDCDPSREEPSSKGERIPVVWDAAKGEFGLAKYGAFATKP